MSAETPFLLSLQPHHWTYRSMWFQASNEPPASQVGWVMSVSWLRAAPVPGTLPMFSWPLGSLPGLCTAAQWGGGSGGQSPPWRPHIPAERKAGPWSNYFLSVLPCPAAAEHPQSQGESPWGSEPVRSGPRMLRGEGWPLKGLLGSCSPGDLCAHQAWWLEPTCARSLMGNPACAPGPMEGRCPFLVDLAYGGFQVPGAPLQRSARGLVGMRVEGPAGQASCCCCSKWPQTGQLEATLTPSQWSGIRCWHCRAPQKPWGGSLVVSFSFQWAADLCFPALPPGPSGFSPCLPVAVLLVWSAWSHLLTRTIVTGLGPTFSSMTSS